jgi:hypothetical protein
MRMRRPSFAGSGRLRAEPVDVARNLAKPVYVLADPAAHPFLPGGKIGR